jgi:hypothetical protein
MIPDDSLARSPDHATAHAPCSAEPGLRDLLDEPIVQELMASDHVTCPELLSLFAGIRRARPYDDPPENETHRGEVRRNQVAVQTVAGLRLPRWAGG